MKGLLTGILISLSKLTEAIEYKKIDKGREIAVASIGTYSYLLIFIAALVGFYFTYRKSKL